MNTTDTGTKGSNSSSGSMLACHAAAPGSIPVVHGRGLWRFISCPSTLETVYLSWFAWPHKWRTCLTDTEWDVKEPLRMTSSLAVTTLSVPIHLKLYAPYTWRASGRGYYGLQLSNERSWIWVLAAAAWCCVLGQDTSPACALSRPRSEWVPGWRVMACVYE